MQKHISTNHEIRLSVRITCECGYETPFVAEGAAHRLMEDHRLLASTEYVVVYEDGLAHTAGNRVLMNRSEALGLASTQNRVFGQDGFHYKVMHLVPIVEETKKVRGIATALDYTPLANDAMGGIILRNHLGHSHKWFAPDSTTFAELVQRHQDEHAASHSPDHLPGV